MRFAVADVHVALLVDENTVGSIQLTTQWIRFRTVAANSCSQHGSNYSAFKIDSANTMILSVDYKQTFMGTVCETFRTGKPGFSSCSTVARIALLARSRDQINSTRFGVNGVDCISFAEGKIKIAFGVHIDRSWTIKWST